MWDKTRSIILNFTNQLSFITLFFGKILLSKIKDTMCPKSFRELDSETGEERGRKEIDFKIKNVREYKPPS